jgi:hypothetical protein
MQISKRRKPLTSGNAARVGVEGFFARGIRAAIWVPPFTFLSDSGS